MTTISKGKDYDGSFWTVTIETEDACQYIGKYRTRDEAWQVANKIDRQ